MDTFSFWKSSEIWYNEQIEKLGVKMNIQQLRYVVAIANSGTFREAAEKMYVSQPSLSISVRDLEKSWVLRFSVGRVRGLFDPSWYGIL